MALARAFWCFPTRCFGHQGISFSCRTSSLFFATFGRPYSGKSGRLRRRMILGGVWHTPVTNRSCSRSWWVEAGDSFSVREVLVSILISYLRSFILPFSRSLPWSRHNMTSTTMNSSTMIPARLPPPGMTSNLIDPASTGYQQTICNIICVTFVTIFVGMRTYTRIKLVKCVSWDDCKCFWPYWWWQTFV